MSGECDVCGQYGHVEFEHCAFKDEFEDLEEKNRELEAATPSLASFTLLNEMYERLRKGYVILRRLYNLTPCDFDVLPEQHEAYKEWREWEEENGRHDSEMRFMRPGYDRRG